MLKLLLTTRRFGFLTIIGIVMLLGSCAEEGITEQNPRTFVIPVSQELIQTSITGSVIDESGEPIHGAEVTFLSGVDRQMTTTDDEGYFLFLDINNKGPVAYLTVESIGKFTAYRKLSVIPSTYNRSVIKMLDRQFIGAIQASTGGTLTREDGSSVTLAANGFIQADGSPYTGEVEVAMTWLDPTAEDLAERMIGDLSGINEAGNFQSLTTYGMLTVELADPAGNPLNISADYPAQLTFPIPAQLRENATTTIPLWTYNIAIGTWIQEGNAYREGNFYIGNVTHFSSFNVDHMTDPIEITGQIVSTNSGGDDTTGLSFLQIYVSSEEIGRKGGYLAADGRFRFYNFPKGEEFTLTVIDQCGGTLQTWELGPYNDNTNIGELIITENMDNFITVTGTANDCDGSLIEQGRINVDIGDINYHYPLEADGTFEFTVNTCGASIIDIVLIDEEQLQTGETSVDIHSSSTDVGNLVSCDELSNFILIDIPGWDPYIFNDVEHKVSSTTDPVKAHTIFFSFPNPTDTSHYEINLGFAYNENTDELTVPFLSYQLGSRYCIPDSTFSGRDLTIEITKYDISPGGEIKGTFTDNHLQCFNWANEMLNEGNATGSFQIDID